MDLIQAWVEYQYAKGANNGTAHGMPANMTSGGLGSSVTMSGVKEDKTGESYNNPFEMVPTTGQLFKQMSSTFLSVTSKEGIDIQHCKRIHSYFSDEKENVSHDNKAFDDK